MISPWYLQNEDSDLFQVFKALFHSFIEHLLSMIVSVTMKDNIVSPIL